MKSETRTGFVLERQGGERGLAQALERSGRTQRWLWLATQAEKATAAEMPRLVRLAAGDDDLIRMLGAHWAELNPAHMCEALLADLRMPDRSLPNGPELLRGLLRDWAKKSPVAVAEALSDDAALIGLEVHRSSGIDAIIREDPALGLRLMKEWNILYYTPSLKSVGEWAAKDPLGAANAIGEMTNTYARADAMKLLGKSWASADPETALDFCKSLDGAPKDELATAVMDHWVKADLDGALAYLADQDDPALLASLSEALVGEWAKTDPGEALAWSQENLPAPARVRSVKALVVAVTKDSLQAGIDLVADLPPGGGKNQATMVLLENWVEQPEVDVKALGDWLNGLEDDAARNRAVDSVQWKWVREHRDSAKAFLEGEHGDLATSGMIRQVLQSDVRADPLGALEWTKGLPGESGERARRIAIEQWYGTQPEAAIQWAAEEARGEERIEAIQSISRSVAFAGEDRLRAWADMLSADERRLAREAIEATNPAEKYAKQIRNVFGE